MRRYGFAEPVEEAAGRLRLVLVVDAVDRNPGAGEPHEKRVFLVAGRAPRGEDIDQRGLAVKIGRLEPTGHALDRRQVELRRRLADQDGGNVGGVLRAAADLVEIDPEDDGERGEGGDGDEG